LTKIEIHLWKNWTFH